MKKVLLFTIIGLMASGKRTTIKTDAKGYVISATDNYGATTETYTLTDCN